MDRQLRMLQLTQLEILKIIDEFCRMHGLRYSLYAGSLLGAVRHGGFIPWDDDLDICMSRAEYDQLIRLWPKEGFKGCLLQNKENSPAFTQSFSKIRKDHTTFLQRDDQKGAYHTGIFVDIFPIDRWPESARERMYFKWNSMQYQLYTREFVPSKASKLVKLGCWLLLMAVPKSGRAQRRKKLLEQITKYNDRKDLKTAAIETMSSLRIEFPADMLDNYTELHFEDADFMCFADWDEHLKCKFGDYMQLPPESERKWKHHPILIDFEHNYEELEHTV